MNGLPLHTHATVQGAQGVRLLKLLGPTEDGARYPDTAVCRQTREGWSGVDIAIKHARDATVLAPGDVVRVREGSSLVSVLWRRGMRANSLFATERCNSLCLMCSQPPRPQADDWRVAEMLATLPLIDPDAKQLGVTGGEPTLLGDGLTHVLDACGEVLPDTHLHVLTNGRNFRNAVEASSWVAAGGARTVWAVPLYADNAALHDQIVGAPGAFEQTLDGLVELATLRARVELRVVLHRLSVPRLRQLAAFIYRRMPFAEHVALMGLEPMGLAKVNKEQLWIDPIDYVADLREATHFLANRGLAVSIYNLPLCVIPKSLWGFARRSISEWKNSYAPECDGCTVRECCAGFFVSAGSAWRSRAIQPIVEGSLALELA